MLDEFVWGKVSRISPEAPVPVVEVQSESSYPGGAANVARNLRPFCKSVHISGLVGCDAAAGRLRNLLTAENIATEGLVEAPEIPTIVKTRIIARQQQVVRVDRERRLPTSNSAHDAVLGQLPGMLDGVDGVIFEDYNKGFLNQGFVDRVSSMVVEAGKILTADPNPGNPLRWPGATTIKPNRSEAFLMSGSNDPGPTVLVTLSEHGMILFDRENPPYHTPTRAKEVFDVSGAGDTAIALFTLALCAGATLQEAAEISNHASGVVVGKFGTAVVTREELLTSFQSHAF